MKTTIKECNCKHESQDAIHGKQMRVHNQTKVKKTESATKDRCTVCGKEK